MLSLSRLRLLPYALALLIPPLAMHAKGAAEVAMAVVDLLFLVRSVSSGDWGWLRRPWVRIGAAWWVWLMLCSLPGVGIGGWHSLGQAAGAVRFLLLVAALEHWLLREVQWQRRMHWMFTACAGWIGLNCLLQVWPGYNLFGIPRFGDGSLTGPFRKPLAGTLFSRLVYPAVLPPVSRLLARHRLGATLGAAGLAMLGIGIAVLIGQRTPVLLTLLGLLASGLLIRRLRPLVLACLVAGAAVLGASRVVSPPTWYRLVTKFTAQMQTFADTDYGLLAWRSIVITAQHPLMGRGYDGFRNDCPNPATFIGWSGEQTTRADGGGARFCNIHPHNHWAQMATDAGLPGLALFAAMVACWLATLLRRLGPGPDPIRAGLFVAVLIEWWPIWFGTGPFDTAVMGISYSLLGCGLAAAHAALQDRNSTP